MFPKTHPFTPNASEQIRPKINLTGFSAGRVMEWSCDHDWISNQVPRREPTRYLAIRCASISLQRNDTVRPSL